MTWFGTSVYNLLAANHCVSECARLGWFCLYVIDCAAEKLVAKGNSSRGRKLANCRESEIKDDTGLWWHPQISPANIETAGFAGSIFRRKNIGGFCRFLKPAARQLGQFSGVMPIPRSRQLFGPQGKKKRPRPQP